MAKVAARTRVVDEHMDYWCICVSDFQMEVVSGERCAETVMIVGPMHVGTAAASTK